MALRGVLGVLTDSSNIFQASRIQLFAPAMSIIPDSGPDQRHHKKDDHFHMVNVLEHRSHHRTEEITSEREGDSPNPRPDRVEQEELETRNVRGAQDKRGQVS